MTFSLRDHVPYLLNRVVSRMVASATPEIRAEGIEINHWRVLAVLRERDGRTAGDVADATSIDRSTLSRVLRRMEDLRLLRRRRSGDDARVVAVYLTSSGRRLGERVQRIASRYESALIRGFSEQELRALRSLLVRAYDNLVVLDASGDASAPERG